MAAELPFVQLLLRNCPPSRRGDRICLQGDCLIEVQLRFGDSSALHQHLSNQHVIVHGFGDNRSRDALADLQRRFQGIDRGVEIALVGQQVGQVLIRQKKTPDFSGGIDLRNSSMAPSVFPRVR